MPQIWSTAGGTNYVAVHTSASRVSKSMMPWAASWYVLCGISGLRAVSTDTMNVSIALKSFRGNTDGRWMNKRFLKRTHNQ